MWVVYVERSEERHGATFPAGADVERFWSEEEARTAFARAVAALRAAGYAPDPTVGLGEIRGVQVLTACGLSRGGELALVALWREEDGA